MKHPRCDKHRFKAYGPSGALSIHEMAVPLNFAKELEEEHSIAEEALREIAAIRTLQTEANNLAVMALRQIKALRAGVEKLNPIHRKHNAP